MSELIKLKSIVNYHDILDTCNHTAKTDLEKFVELYKLFGIELVVEQKTVRRFSSPNVSESRNIFQILLSADDDQFGGYYGFESSVVFDEEGNFITQDFYE
jgi:hypothetical protein